MTTVEKIVFTTDGSGAASVLSIRPVSGHVVEVRVPNAGTDWLVGGQTDLTLTRREDGGTVLAVSNATAPFSYQPSPAFHTVAGAVAGTASRPGIPVDDHLRLVVAQGAASKAGTVFVAVAA